MMEFVGSTLPVLQYGRDRGIFFAVIYVSVCFALIVAGMKAIMGARQASTWDPSVAKMSVGSGIFGILLGIFLLYQGWRGFGLFSLSRIF